MSDACRSVGSVWKRWDLHLHAPGTKLSNGFGEASEENLLRYVEALEASEVQVFGITDYFSFDSYLVVSEAYQAAYPDGKKLFIPNIEFRLTETISKDARHVHTHVLIDPKAGTKAKLTTLLSDLLTHITRDGGRRVRCGELSSTSDYEQATVSITELGKALDAVFSDRTAYIIVTAANNDGLKGVDTKSPRSMSISDELDKASDAFFGSSKNSDYFLGIERYEDKTPSEPKPVFSGSDAHSFDDLARLSGDEAGYEGTWIKADLTFRGLRQTLFEPKGRVHLGERPPVLKRQDQDATRFITALEIDHVAGYSGANGSWFKDIIIPFNPELTAIIGNKGSGKSAVADIIGLLGESRQFEHFSFLTDKMQNRKFRQKGFAESFVGTLSWASGAKPQKRLDQDVDLSKPEVVKYLPQNYFESLTNEIEVKAFRGEVEKVVFSHVEESDRMGKSTFLELEELKTAQSKSDISTLKVRLQELNIEIVELEGQATPATKAALSEQLKQKQEEYRVLEASIPTEVPKPESETSEQIAIGDQIEKVRRNQSDLESRGKETVERLSSLKSDLVGLGDIKEAVIGLDSQIKDAKEELRAACTRLDMDVDAIIKHGIDTSTVDAKIADISARIKVLEADSEVAVTDATEFSSLVSVPDLRRAHQFLSEKLKGLQETLSAPQRRYQRYVQAVSDLATKMTDVMGNEENPKPGTIKYIEHRIRYIENELTAKLEAKYTDRDQIARSIFEAKKKVRVFYEALKSSVEERLASVRSEEFEVTIDASFVPSYEFPELFFDLVNQASSGPFRGTAQGGAELEARLAETDWNNVDRVLGFANGIIDAIRTEDVSKQVKDVKRLYDLLFSFEYFDARYELRLGGKNLNQLSPGEKGLLLLVFYLHLDKEKTPLIIDQPEDNLDNDSIFSVLANCIRQAKKTRQVILVTHNPNLAVGADAEQVLYVSLDKAAGYKFSYESGAIENPRINDIIVKILEGSKPAFVQRRLKYQIK
ncbi:TrlF family AAA-like ATPase [Thalassospira sp.]|uniref:TrlF family AAA-like ATPase n=1 Tax=Thalassospira sp. TaxID=1912094 RepID=UPI00273371AF|nr:AAA family ATPase [Thalassospira sp.]MDP2699685.1 AAA family ATPase [Thalassospira sp.]